MTQSDKEYKTAQEEFWAGTFGDAYSQRNTGDHLIRANTALFRKLLKKASNIQSIAEFGCNIGLNLEALKSVCPDTTLTGLEINKGAADIAAGKNIARIVNQTILEPLPSGHTFDLTFTKGVLIHINPDELPLVYKHLYDASRRYIAVCEYYNPTPVTVTYRGETERLFKRDFAGELIKTYNLKLIDYGFCYHGDPECPLDDTTWFLLEK